MATNNVLGTVYETLLCSPGMNEVVKIDAKIKCKTVLLLNAVIEKGISGKDTETNELLKLLPEDATQELLLFCEEALKKAGLQELCNKMKELAAK